MAGRADHKVNKGDTVRFDEGMTMESFHSKGLNRTFPKIVFVNKLVVEGRKNKRWREAPTGQISQKFFIR